MSRSSFVLQEKIIIHQAWNAFEKWVKMEYFNYLQYIKILELSPINCKYVKLYN